MDEEISTVDGASPMTQREESIREHLQSVGMRTFVNCFEATKEKREVLTEEELLQHDPKSREVDRSLRSLMIKRYVINEIFKKKWEWDALKICVEGSTFAKQSPEEHQKAKEILNHKDSTPDKSEAMGVSESTRSENIREYLQSVGMRTFVNCFEPTKEKGEELTEEELLQHDPELRARETDLSLRSQIIKRYGINEIFQKGWEWDALKMCVEGSTFARQSPEAHQKAKEILSRK